MRTYTTSTLQRWKLEGAAELVGEPVNGIGKLRWKSGTIETIGVKGLLDRNSDGILEAAYVASFKRPAAGAYRFVTRYAGNATYAPSKRTLSFKL